MVTTPSSDSGGGGGPDPVADPKPATPKKQNLPSAKPTAVDGGSGTPGHETPGAGVRATTVGADQPRAQNSAVHDNRLV